MQISTPDFVQVSTPDFVQGRKKEKERSKN